MPVPSSITDLSKNASDNSPQGTESAKGTIDDYFRAQSSFIRQIFDQTLGPSVGLASATTVNIGFAAALNVIISGSTTITSFDAAQEGTLRWIVFNGAMLIGHSNDAIVLPGAANITTAFGDAALFKCTGGARWICLSYMRQVGTGPVKASASRDGYLAAGDFGTFAAKQDALGFTPYPASNPANYTTLSAVGGSFLPLGGGVLSGSIDFLNGVGIYMRDASNNSRQFVRMQGNGVNFTIAGGAAFNYYNQNGDTIVASLTNAGVWSANVIVETSDERKKKAWQRVPRDLVERLAGIRKSGLFTWKRGGERGLGVGAQSLEQILPEAVHTDGSGAKSVQYGAAALVSAVELARAVVDLRARLDKLEGK